MSVPLQTKLEKSVDRKKIWYNFEYPKNSRTPLDISYAVNEIVNVVFIVSTRLKPTTHYER